MANNMGFSVRIFVPSGEPEGLRIVEKSNWTGQGLVFPRALFAAAKQRPEICRTGVYVLWGPGEPGQLPRVYIGEGDVVRARMESHVHNKDFWTHGLVFTSKDQNLNKAHVQHLEAELVRLATEAKRCELDNGNVPQKPLLSEADTADADAFLADILLCLPVVGVSFFEKSKALSNKRKDSALLLHAKSIEARGADEAEGFIVFAGSRAVKKETPSIHAYMSQLRKTLIEKGVLEDAGDTYRVTQDYTFDSPSTASGVLLGAASNGRTAWKDASGRTLREMQEAETAST